MHCTNNSLINVLLNKVKSIFHWIIVRVYHVYHIFKLMYQFKKLISEITYSLVLQSAHVHLFQLPPNVFLFKTKPQTLLKTCLFKDSTLFLSFFCPLAQGTVFYGSSFQWRCMCINVQSGLDCLCDHLLYKIH